MSAFQFIFDMAESISINKRPMVAQSISRDNTVRSVVRTGDTWRFDVKLPDGIPWTTLRPYIEQMEYLDRYTSAAIQINNAGYNSWLTNYQGDAATTSGFAATWIKNTKYLTLTSSPSVPTNSMRFRAGDLIQLGTGRVYSVVTDVPSTSGTVYLNRNIHENTVASPQSLTVGPNVSWRVLCTQMPTWTIFARDQVSWNGSFQFYEDNLYYGN